MERVSCKGRPYDVDSMDWVTGWRLRYYTTSKRENVNFSLMLPEDILPPATHLDRSILLDPWTQYFPGGPILSFYSIL